MTWLDVAAVDELFEGASIAIAPAGRDIALHCVEGVPFATDNVCTHGAGRLCEGFLEGHEIECPLHQGRFDVRSGQPMGEPATLPIRVYAAKVDGGRVWVDLEPAST